MTFSAVFFASAHLLNLAAIIVLVFFQRKEPSTRYTWILVFLLLPYLGVALYLLFGHNYARREQIQYSQEALREVDDIIASQIRNSDKMLFADKRFIKVAHMNLVNDHMRVTSNNKVRIFNNGADKFASLKQDIREAREYVHLLYFIFRTDELGREIIDLLTEKAEQGVDVKVVYDDIGNFAVSSLAFHKLRKAGGSVHRYSPIITSLFTANYRNHRKLALIDGKIGYVGGMNIGSEYIHGKGKLTPWRDTHVRLEGSVVGSMEALFLSDYHYAAHKVDRVESMGKIFNPSSNISGCSTAQLLSSGPQHGRASIYKAYTKIFNVAEKYLYIQTPYLIPDRMILNSLKNAQASGVDVRVMLPTYPDKSLVYLATLNYARELCCTWGIKVYFYNGFLHSKMVLADDQIISIGSANMDMRSFFLSYEANIFIYDRSLTEQQREQFHTDMEHCVLADGAYFDNLPAPVRVLMPFCQLLAPLM